MGDPNPNNVTPIPIPSPPGFLFYPTEEQLLCYYLRNKNKNNLDLSFPSVSDVDYLHLGLDMVKEINFYGYDPCHLPDVARFRYGHGGSRKHWYCFTAKTSTGHVRRKAKGGFWKREGRARDILDGKDGHLLGKRKTFVFYRRSLSLSIKTGWVLYEYSLVGSLKDPFALCRVFKSHPGSKIAARRITDMDVPYRHHRGALGSGIGEALAHADTSVGTDNDIQGLLMERTCGLCDTILAQPASGDGFQLPMTISQPYQLVELSNGIVSGSNHSTICASTMTDQQICNSVILEGDFIELNDLITPLPDVDA